VNGDLGRPHAFPRLYRRLAGLLTLPVLAALACGTLLGPDRGPEATALAVTLDALATIIANYTPTPAGTPVVEIVPTTITEVTPLPPATLEPNATPLPTSAPPPTDPPGFYAVQSGDTLRAVALRLRLDPADLLLLNTGLPLTQTLEPGRWLTLPETAFTTGFGTALLPDSELVNAPSAAGFDVQAFVLSQPGYLATYTEVITETEPAEPGWQIVAEAAQRYSINPRLLLALLEQQTGALSNPNADQYTQLHSLGLDAPALLPGLSHQLGWAGNQLNYGYYGWRDGSLLNFATADGQFNLVDGRLNAGSFAVARLLALLYKRPGFEQVTGPEGLMATYKHLFGDPWATADPAFIPGLLTQPPLQLPFEPGVRWSFSGGPHPGYGSTLPFAALDFAPPSQLAGCAPNPQWVVAVHDGVVVFSDDGLLELDIGDGWSVVYLHLATLDRAPVGTVVTAGIRLGHPSCEGGRATGSHLHLARKFRGEWVPADGFAPFEMSSWLAGPYYGTLTKGTQVVASCSCANAQTQIGIEP
jgi:LasA protease